MSPVNRVSTKYTTQTDLQQGWCRILDFCRRVYYPAARSRENSNLRLDDCALEVWIGLSEACP